MNENPSGWAIGLGPNPMLHRGDDRVWQGLDGLWYARSRGETVGQRSLPEALAWCDDMAAFQAGENVVPGPDSAHPGWEVRETGVDGKPAIWWRIAPGARFGTLEERHDTVRRIGGLWEAHPAVGRVLSFDAGMGREAVLGFGCAGDAIAALDRWNAARSAEMVRAWAWR